MPKLRPVAVVELDAYRVIGDAVERGVAGGVEKAFKYWEPGLHPQSLDQLRALLKQHVEQYVDLELAEVIRWPD